MNLTTEQTEALLKPIHPTRVHKQQGLSHVEAYDIRAMLIRVFGFNGFSIVNNYPTALLYEQETKTKAGAEAFKVAYHASVRLVFPDGATFDGTAVGESIMPDFKRGDAHDMAIKTAESQALKRAAINLGDQFGLSLYRNGSIEPLVRKAWNGTEYVTLAKKEPTNE